MLKDKFKYYQNEESDSHLGVIDFNKVEASVYLLPDSSNTFKITVNGSDKQFIFRAQSSDEATEWVK